ncbi:MAG: PD-(D/E)XK nuclease family protein [Candidatus Izemoplasmatales bacterium]|jgi:RecB family exonuclease
MNFIIEALKDIPNHALVVSSKIDHDRISHAYGEQCQLVPFRVRQSADLLPQVGYGGLLYLEDKYRLPYPHAVDVIGMLDYLEEKHRGISKRIDYYLDMKMDLMERKHVSFFSQTSMAKRPIFWINHIPIEWAKRHIGSLRIIDELEISAVPYFMCAHKDQEIMMVYRTVINLLESGTMPGSIAIMNTTPTDDDTLRRMLEDTKIPVHVARPVQIARYPFVIEWMRIVQENPRKAFADFEAALLTHNNADFPVRMKVLDLINTYGKERLLKHPDFLRFLIEQTVISPPSRPDAIALLPNLQANRKYQTSIVMNVNEDFFQASKPTTLLSVSEQEAIQWPSQREKYQARIMELESTLRVIPGLILTMSRVDKGIPKRHIKLEIGRQVIHSEPRFPEHHAFYSPNIDRLRYAKMRYKMIHYGTLEAEYATYEKTFRDELDSYHFQFSGIDRDTLSALIEPSITLSATSLSRYYQCPFAFLLQSLFRLKPQTESPELVFGNIAHRLLEQSINPDDVSSDVLLESLRDQSPDVNQGQYRLFLEAFMQRFKDVHRTLNEFHEHTRFHEVAHEWSFSFRAHTHPRFIIKGTIDRIMADETREHPSMVLMDYKTGKKTFNIDDFTRGVDVQLPFYMYLLHHNESFKRVPIFGIFYLPLPLGRISASKTDTPIKDVMLFDGRLIGDKELIERFAPEGWIKGVRWKVDGGLYKNQRIVNPQEMNDLESHVATLIDQAIDRIVSGDFSVRPQPPKIAGTRSKSCRYCPYDSICYVTHSADEEDVEAGEDDEA